MTTFPPYPLPMEGDNDGSEPVKIFTAECRSQLAGDHGLIAGKPAPARAMRPAGSTPGVRQAFRDFFTGSQGSFACPEGRGPAEA